MTHLEPDDLDPERWARIGGPQAAARLAELLAAGAGPKNGPTPPDGATEVLADVLAELKAIRQEMADLRARVDEKTERPGPPPPAGAAELTVRTPPAPLRLSVDEVRNLAAQAAEEAWSTVNRWPIGVYRTVVEQVRPRAIGGRMGSGTAWVYECKGYLRAGWGLRSFVWRWSAQIDAATGECVGVDIKGPRKQ